MPSADLQTITLHRRAAAKLTALPESERRLVEKTLLEMHGVSLDALPVINLKAPQYPHLYSIRSGPSLRLLFVKTNNGANILDIVDRSELPIAA
jgi:hypothetical protein